MNKERTMKKKKDNSFAWNKTIQAMQVAEKTERSWDDDPNPIQDLKDAELYDLLPDSEKCNCNHNAEHWKYHKQYCPIWKNGRIKELENDSIINFKLKKEVNNFIEVYEYYKETVSYRDFFEKVRWLLKQ